MDLEVMVIDEGETCRIEGRPEGHRSLMLVEDSEGVVYLATFYLEEDTKKAIAEAEHARDQVDGAFEKKRRAHAESYRGTFYRIAGKFDQRLGRIARKCGKADEAWSQRARTLRDEGWKFDLFVGKKGEVMAHAESAEYIGSQGEGRWH